MPTVRDNSGDRWRKEIMSVSNTNPPETALLQVTTERQIWTSWSSQLYIDKRDFFERDLLYGYFSWINYCDLHLPCRYEIFNIDSQLYIEKPSGKCCVELIPSAPGVLLIHKYIELRFSSDFTIEKKRHPVNFYTRRRWALSPAQHNMCRDRQLSGKMARILGFCSGIQINFMLPITNLKG